MYFLYWCQSVCRVELMGAAATVSKDEDKTCSQKAATSLKSPDCNKTTTMVTCSGCKTPLNIFKRKVSLYFFIYFTAFWYQYRVLYMLYLHACMVLFNVIKTRYFKFALSSPGMLAQALKCIWVIFVIFYHVHE